MRSKKKKWGRERKRAGENQIQEDKKTDDLHGRDWHVEGRTRAGEEEDDEEERG